MLNLHSDFTSTQSNFLLFLLSEFHIRFEINPFSQIDYRPNAMNNGESTFMPFVCICLTISFGKYMCFGSVGSAKWKPAFLAAW